MVVFLDLDRIAENGYSRDQRSGSEQDHVWVRAGRIARKSNIASPERSAKGKENDNHHGGLKNEGGDIGAHVANEDVRSKITDSAMDPDTGIGGATVASTGLNMNNFSEALGCYPYALKFPR